MKQGIKLALVGLLTCAFIFVGGAEVATAQPLSFFTATDLTVGSRGQAVVDLQGILAEMGYLILPAKTTLGYFGPLTKSALMKYQTALGVPATGYFGSMTRSAILNHFAQRNWSNGNGELAVGRTTNTGGMSQNGMVAGASTSTMSTGWTGTTHSGTTTTSFTNSMTTGTTTLSGGRDQTPLSPTGYWSSGSWFNSIPHVGTSTNSGIAGYWHNGTWYPIQSGIAAEQNSNTSGTSGRGYWYNGVWTPVGTTTFSGGFYSSNPSVTSGGTTN